MICAAQRDDGALPGIVPTSGWGFAWGNGPVWDQALVELPYRTYLYRGDSSLFLECADAVVRYLNYISQKRDERGLLNIGLGDWCHALRRGGANHLCPNEVSDTVTAYSICRRAEWMFGEVGQLVQQRFAGILGDEFYAAIRKYLIDPSTCTMRGSCQAAQAIGLYYGVFEPGERQAAYQRLLQLIHLSGDRMDFGMIGARVVFRTLAEFGNAELAYRMITRTDAPSYGIAVSDFGLVSVPETFEPTVNGYQTSLNHHFMSDFSGFFIAYIAGLQINPYRNDPSFVRVQPSFLNQLNYAQAHCLTPAGRVAVRWEKHEGGITLTVEKAEGVSGELLLPGGFVFSVAQGYRPDWLHGRRMLELQSGIYELAAR